MTSFILEIAYAFSSEPSLLNTTPTSKARYCDPFKRLFCIPNTLSRKRSVGGWVRSRVQSSRRWRDWWCPNCPQEKSVLVGGTTRTSSTIYLEALHWLYTRVRRCPISRFLTDRYPRLSS